MFTRREALLSALCACLSRPAFAGNAIEAGLSELEHEAGGRVGVYAHDTGSGEALFSHRADERFAMCSTFKAPLAAAILAKVDAGGLQLDQRVPYTQADLLSYAPVARERVAEGALPIRDLCAAAVDVREVPLQRRWVRPGMLHLTSSSDPARPIAR